MTVTESLQEAVQRQRHIRFGIVGLGFIARLHVEGIKRLDPLCSAELELMAGADTDPGAIDRFPHTLARTSEDFRDVTRAADVDVVIVSVPNDQHLAVVEDALSHGKFVVCEKPLAANISDARRIHEASENSSFGHTAAFVFRTWPTVELAKQLIAAGEIGDIFAYRGHMLHGHGLDPEYPTSWRMDQERSGGGVVVDIGSHSLDLARYLVGEVTAVSALSQTVVPERPDGYSSATRTPVHVDDHTAMLLTFENGASGQITVSWAACGESTDVAFEVLGTKGTLRFSWRRPEELYVATLGDAPRTVTLGEEHPDSDLRFPVSGLGLGYVDAFTSLHRRVVNTLMDVPTVAPPTIDDAMRCAEIIDAAQRSAGQNGGWQAVHR